MTEQQPPADEGEFFQKPTFNAKERLICSHLIATVEANPLDTALHITQAALLLDEEALEALKVDRDQVLIIYTVAYRLANPEKTAYPNGAADYAIFLGSLDFDKYLKPWLNEHIYVRGSKDELAALNEEKKLQRRLFLSLSHLTETGYHSLVGDFMMWAGPTVQEIGGKLAQTVSPETYTDLLRIVVGDKRA